MLLDQCIRKGGRPMIRSSFLSTVFGGPALRRRRRASARRKASRTPLPYQFVAQASACGLFFLLSLPLLAQTTKSGDWPYYTGDLKGTKYSPLDQINATNFS